MLLNREGVMSLIDLSAMPMSYQSKSKASKWQRWREWPRTPRLGSLCSSLRSRRGKSTLRDETTTSRGKEALVITSTSSTRRRQRMSKTRGGRQLWIRRDRSRLRGLERRTRLARDWYSRSRDKN